MISSITTSDKIVRAGQPPTAHLDGSRGAATRPDNFSSDGTSCLKAALDRQPAVRPDVVERARALATDPDYPSAEVIRQIARQILAAPDLSEAEG